MRKVDMMAMRSLAKLYTSTDPHERSYLEHPLIECYLGGGCFGKAFLLKDGTVFKISLTEDATTDFIFHAARHYRNTGKARMLMPEVYAFGLIDSGGWWAVMERIERATDRNEFSYFTRYVLREGTEEEQEALTGLEREFVLDDDHAGNWGWTCKGNRLVLFDPSSDSSCARLSEVIPPQVKPKNLYGAGRGRWQQ